MWGLLATGTATVAGGDPNLAGVLAHQGGWDELGLVLAPLVVVAGLLVVANRRAKRLLGEQQRATGGAAAGVAEQPADGRPDEP